MNSSVFIETFPRKPSMMRTMSGFSPRGGMKSIRRTAPLFVSISVSRISVSPRYRRHVTSTFSFGKKRQCPFSLSPSNDAKHAGESNLGKQSQSTQPSRLTSAPVWVSLMKPKSSIFVVACATYFVLLLVIVIVLGVSHDRQLVASIRLEFRLQAASMAHASHIRVNAELRTFGRCSRGAHAPSRGGHSESFRESRTFSDHYVSLVSLRLKRFSEGAETCTRGRMRS